MRLEWQITVFKMKMNPDREVEERVIGKRGILLVTEVEEDANWFNKEVTMIIKTLKGRLSMTNRGEAVYEFDRPFHYLSVLRLLD